MESELQIAQSLAFGLLDSRTAPIFIFLFFIFLFFIFYFFIFLFFYFFIFFGWRVFY